MYLVAFVVHALVPVRLVALSDMNTYDFTGDGVTILGFVGVLSTLVILFTVFRRFYNSPLNK